MADESITWPAPPDVTDATDGAQSYNMGRVFTLTEDAPVVGVEWRVPDVAPVSPAAGSPAGGAYAVALWDVTGGTRLAYKVVTPTPGGVQRFIFAEGDYLAGVVYQGLTTDTLQATIYTNHYVYAAGDDAGSTSPSGIAVAGASRLADSNAGATLAPQPVSPTTLNFYVGPVVSAGDEPEDHTTTGTIPVKAAATAAVATVRAVARTAPVVATATAAVVTARTTSGTAGVAATATATTGTARATSGTAAVRVTATAARSTARTTAGAASVRVTGGSYSATGVKGPRLVSRRQQGRIVARAQVAS